MSKSNKDAIAAKSNRSRDRNSEAGLNSLPAIHREERLFLDVLGWVVLLYGGGTQIHGFLGASDEPDWRANPGFLAYIG